ncbi:relaxase [Escherichia coli]|uniref:Relaxase n=1 Tax=Escherichia coli TaxID=562 RepID=A0A377BE76_ECOLX|nr:relaxase [Escherichia coli]
MLTTRQLLRLTAIFRKAEMELSKELIRHDQYVKSGNSETAREHKAEVLDYLKDKIATAKEARENVLEAFAKNGSSSEQAKAKEMVIVASKLPKDFLLGGDGKAYNDAFTPKPFPGINPATGKAYARPSQTITTAQNIL